jgi:hypothetical protein
LEVVVLKQRVSHHVYKNIMLVQWTSNSDSLSFYTPGWGSGSEQFRISQDGTVRYRVGHTTISDARIKINIHDIPDMEALEKLRLLNPKTYNYIENDRPQDTIYGFLAQEVKEILPYAVRVGEEPHKPQKSSMRMIVHLNFQIITPRVCRFQKHKHQRIIKCSILSL